MIVVCRIFQFKSSFNSKFKYGVSKKIRCIIKNESIRYAKPGNDELIYEFNNYLKVGYFQRNCFYPLCKVISGCKDISMLLGGMWNNLSYFIQSPLFKWLFNVDWLQRKRWLSLSSTGNLICSTFSYIFMGIFE